MAIQIAHDTKYGDSYVSAYANIYSIKIQYTRAIAEVVIAIYRSDEDREAGKAPVEFETLIYTGDAFQEIFRELTLDNVSGVVSPVRNVYEDLAKKEDTKYFEADKLYDVIEGKEVSKYEKVKRNAEDAEPPVEEEPAP